MKLLYIPRIFGIWHLAFGCVRHTALLLMLLRCFVATMSYWFIESNMRNNMCHFFHLFPPFGGLRVLASQETQLAFVRRGGLGAQTLPVFGLRGRRAAGRLGVFLGEHRSKAGSGCASCWAEWLHDVFRRNQLNM